MMKIKVFKFVVSNFGYKTTKEWHKNLRPESVYVDNEQDIEDIVNGFIESEEVLSPIDIKINQIDSSFHNNGGSNRVELIYTVIYNG